MRLLVALCSLATVAALVAGCATQQKAAGADAAPNAPALQAQQPPAQAPAGVQPMAAAPIPNAPVAGTESLQGSGGGTGQAAKDMARRAAGQAASAPPIDPGE